MCSSYWFSVHDAWPVPARIVCILKGFQAGTGAQHFVCEPGYGIGRGRSRVLWMAGHKLVADWATTCTSNSVWYWHIKPSARWVKWWTAAVSAQGRIVTLFPGLRPQFSSELLHRELLCKYSLSEFVLSISLNHAADKEMMLFLTEKKMKPRYLSAHACL